MGYKEISWQVVDTFGYNVNLHKMGQMMRKTQIKPISDKQAIKNAHWKKVTDERAEEECYLCQWCSERGQRINPDNPWTYLTGHHTIKRRYNIHTRETCYIVHLICHGEIGDNNVDVKKYPNREAWIRKVQDEKN